MTWPEWSREFDTTFRRMHENKLFPERRRMEEIPDPEADLLARIRSLHDATRQGFYVAYEHEATAKALEDKGLISRKGRIARVVTQGRKA